MKYKTTTIERTKLRLMRDAIKASLPYKAQLRIEEERQARADYRAWREERAAHAKK